MAGNCLNASGFHMASLEIPTSKCPKGPGSGPSRAYLAVRRCTRSNPTGAALRKPSIGVRTWCEVPSFSRTLFTDIATSGMTQLFVNSETFSLLRPRCATAVGGSSGFPTKPRLLYLYTTAATFTFLCLKHYMSGETRPSIRHPISSSGPAYPEWQSTGKSTLT